MADSFAELVFKSERFPPALLQRVASCTDLKDRAQWDALFPIRAEDGPTPYYGPKDQQVSFWTWYLEHEFPAEEFKPPPKSIPAPNPKRARFTVGQSASFARFVAFLQTAQTAGSDYGAFLRGLKMIAHAFERDVFGRNEIQGWVHPLLMEFADRGGFYKKEWLPHYTQRVNWHAPYTTPSFERMLAVEIAKLKRIIEQAEFVQGHVEALEDDLRVLSNEQNLFINDWKQNPQDGYDTLQRIKGNLLGVLREELVGARDEVERHRGVFLAQKNVSWDGILPSRDITSDAELVELLATVAVFADHGIPLLDNIAQATSKEAFIKEMIATITSLPDLQLGVGIHERDLPRVEYEEERSLRAQLQTLSELFTPRSVWKELALRTRYETIIDYILQVELEFNSPPRFMSLPPLKPQYGFQQPPEFQAMLMLRQEMTDLGAACCMWVRKEIAARDFYLDNYDADLRHAEKMAELETERQKYETYCEMRRMLKKILVQRGRMIQKYDLLSSDPNREMSVEYDNLMVEYLDLVHEQRWDSVSEYPEQLFLKSLMRLPDTDTTPYKSIPTLTYSLRVRTVHMLRHQEMEVTQMNAAWDDLYAEDPGTRDLVSYFFHDSHYSNKLTLFRQDLLPHGVEVDNIVPRLKALSDTAINRATLGEFALLIPWETDAHCNFGMAMSEFRRQYRAYNDWVLLRVAEYEQIEADRLRAEEEEKEGDDDDDGVDPVVRTRTPDDVVPEVVRADTPPVMIDVPTPVVTPVVSDNEEAEVSSASEEEEEEKEEVKVIPKKEETDLDEMFKPLVMQMKTIEAMQEKMVAIVKRREKEVSPEDLEWLIRILKVKAQVFAVRSSYEDRSRKALEAAIQLYKLKLYEIIDSKNENLTLNEIEQRWIERATRLVKVAPVLIMKKSKAKKEVEVPPILDPDVLDDKKPEEKKVPELPVEEGVVINPIVENKEVIGVETPELPIPPTTTPKKSRKSLTPTSAAAAEPVPTSIDGRDFQTKLLFEIIGFANSIETAVRDKTEKRKDQVTAAEKDLRKKSKSAYNKLNELKTVYMSADLKQNIQVEQSGGYEDMKKHIVSYIKAVNKFNVENSKATGVTILKKTSLEKLEGMLRKQVSLASTIIRSDPRAALSVTPNKRASMNAETTKAIKEEAAKTVKEEAVEEDDEEDGMELVDARHKPSLIEQE